MLIATKFVGVLQLYLGTPIPGRVIVPNGKARSCQTGPGRGPLREEITLNVQKRETIKFFDIGEDGENNQHRGLIIHFLLTFPRLNQNKTA